jgi:hypothetical protein
MSYDKGIHVTTREMSMSTPPLTINQYPSSMSYLRRLFAQLRKAKTVEDFEALLPFSNLSDKAISNT